jgi:hypothetical protein
MIDEPAVEETFAHRRADVVSDVESAECECPENCLRDHEYE